MIHDRIVHRAGNGVGLGLLTPSFSPMRFAISVPTDTCSSFESQTRRKRTRCCLLIQGDRTMSVFGLPQYRGNRSLVDLHPHPKIKLVAALGFFVRHKQLRMMTRGYCFLSFDEDE